MSRVLVRCLTACVVLSCTLSLAASRADATTTITINGTAVCGGGLHFVGVYVHSSGGGDKFADWTPYPGAAVQASYSTSVTTNLPTTVYLSVGCGGHPSSWRTSNDTPALSITSGRTLNTWCDGTGKCTFANKFDGTPPDPGHNTFPAGQCTYRADTYWHSISSHWANWSGDAQFWDNNAHESGWTVVPYAMPHSIIVWDSSAGNPAASADGHVGYAPSMRINSNHTVEVRIFDQNWDNHGGIRNGVWVLFTSRMHSIVPPPAAG